MTTSRKMVFNKANKLHRIKIVPIITWRPWNPVSIKNTEPYIPSEIEKVHDNIHKLESR